MIKFQRNIERDSMVHNQLALEGIKQLVIWECTVKRMIKDSCVEKEVVARIGSFFRSKIEFLEI